jgi:hypothetical protein
MPRLASCYEILIASPSDVLAERQIIVECIEDWNAAHSKSTNVILQPRRWELDVYPELGDRPQEIINKQIVDNTDMLFGVFWHRVGTPSGVAQSGTIEEIERSVNRSKPVFLYFSQAPVPMTHDATQLAGVQEYKGRMRQHGVAFDFPNVHEFRRMVSRHLAMRVNALLEGPGVGPETTAPEESNLARVRVRAGQKGRNGDVTTINVIGELQNLTTSTRIRDYSCQLMVPPALLKFASATYMAEVKSERAGIRVFRRTEANFGNVPIFPGDSLPVVSVEIAIDHLEMKELTGLSRQEAHDLTMNGVIIAEATVDGKLLRAKKAIREIFSLAGGSGRVSLRDITE